MALFDNTTGVEWDGGNSPAARKRRRRRQSSGQGDSPSAGGFSLSSEDGQPVDASTENYFPSLIVPVDASTHDSSDVLVPGAPWSAMMGGSEDLLPPAGPPAGGEDKPFDGNPPPADEPATVPEQGAIVLLPGDGADEATTAVPRIDPSSSDGRSADHHVVEQRNKSPSSASSSGTTSTVAPVEEDVAEGGQTTLRGILKASSKVPRTPSQIFDSFQAERSLREQAEQQSLREFLSSSNPMDSDSDVDEIARTTGPRDEVHGEEEEEHGHDQDRKDRRGPSSSLLALGEFTRRNYNDCKPPATYPPADSSGKGKDAGCSDSCFGFTLFLRRLRSAMSGVREDMQPDLDRGVFVEEEAVPGIVTPVESKEADVSGPFAGAPQSNGAAGARAAEAGAGGESSSPPAAALQRRISWGEYVEHCNYREAESET